MLSLPVVFQSALYTHEPSENATASQVQANEKFGGGGVGEKRVWANSYFAFLFHCPRISDRLLSLPSLPSIETTGASE